MDGEKFGENNGSAPRDSTTSKRVMKSIRDRFNVAVNRLGFADNVIHVRQKLFHSLLVLESTRQRIANSGKLRSEFTEFA